jgi:hypothetical protein
MRMRPLPLAAAVLLGTLALAPGARAADRCARLEARIAALEAAGAPAVRIDRLARRFTRSCVRLNEVQVLGTHNSYHIQPRQSLLDLLLLFDPTLFALEYTHVPLAEQFEMRGIRQIELDVFADPDGGLFASRPALALVGDPTEGDPALLEPGLKVLHVQDVDFESTCLTFVSCLETIRRWSDHHRGHLPIMVLVEAKDDTIPDPLDLGFVVPLPIDLAMLDEIDAEIRSVFRARRLITPDDVRGAHATLDEAVRTDGWPTLRKARGRVLFALDNQGGVRSLYRMGRPALEGRVLFTSATPGDADAAFLKLNDAFGDETAIRDGVAAGYIVRTRADADTIEARSGSTTRRDVALASGAQYVSTDYPVPDPDFGTGYFVAIPDGSPGRCNPVNAPAACRSDALERR